MRMSLMASLLETFHVAPQRPIMSPSESLLLFVTRFVIGLIGVAGVLVVPPGITKGDGFGAVTGIVVGVVPGRIGLPGITLKNPGRAARPPVSRPCEDEPR